MRTKTTNRTMRMIEARRIAALRLGIAAGGAPPAASTTLLPSLTAAAASSFESITRSRSSRPGRPRVRVNGPSRLARHPLWSGSSLTHARYAGGVSRRRRLLLSGAVVGAVAAGVGARLRLSGNENRTDVPLVSPSSARGLVEAALGARGERRNLALDFEPATASSWELLIDGGSFFPRLLEDIGTSTQDVHILIFGFKSGKVGDDFRDKLVAKAAAGVGVRIITEAAFSQPGLGSKAFYRSLVDGGVQVVANQGGFVDLDGLLGQRRIDWRFDDFGHFDHRKVVVIDGRVGYVGGPGIEDHYATGTHDVMLRLEGPIVAQLQAVFLLSWQLQGGPLPESAEGLDRFFPPV